MGLFGCGKKKEPQPMPARQPDPKPVEISEAPHQQFVLIDGQWYINPKYDPKAPKPEGPRVIGLGSDDEVEDDDD